MNKNKTRFEYPKVVKRLGYHPAIGKELSCYFLCQDGNIWYQGSPSSLWSNLGPITEEELKKNYFYKSYSE